MAQIQAQLAMQQSIISQLLGRVQPAAGACIQGVPGVPPPVTGAVLPPPPAHLIQQMQTIAPGTFPPRQEFGQPQLTQQAQQGSPARSKSAMGQAYLAAKGKGKDRSAV
eukprot:5418243-Pyramimonas_sp.AAC.1